MYFENSKWFVLILGIFMCFENLKRPIFIFKDIYVLKKL